MATHSSPVPRGLRLLNVLSLLLFLAGAGLYIRAWFGMERLQTYEADPEAALFSGLAEFDHFWNLSRIGIWLVWAAVAVAVIAAIAAVVVRWRAGTLERPVDGSGA